MKSSDLKVGVGYAYFPGKLHDYNRPYHVHTCLIPLDTKVYHEYRDGDNNRVIKPGRKAQGYGTDWYNHSGKPYIDACGVPCMVANRQGPIKADTMWTFKLIPPIQIWQEWGDMGTQYAEQERKRKQEEAERAEARAAHQTAVLNAKAALSTLELTESKNYYDEKDTGGYVTAYGGIMFKSTTQLTWLAEFIAQYNDLVEEVKDLRYELED